MAVGGSAAASRQPDARRVDAPAREREARAPRADELAWIALVPCAVAVVAAIVVLGPPLGEVLFPASTYTFWPRIVEISAPTPEPTEQARFLLALAGPLLLTACVVLGKRHARTLPAAAITSLVVAAQALAVGFVIACYAIQHQHEFLGLAAYTASSRTVYFTVPTLVVGAAIALAIALGVVRAGAAQRFGALVRERPARRIAGSAVALVATLVWLLPGINFERTIARANNVIVNHMPFWLDEAFAVLDGRYPLVDFAAQYGSLWPYGIAAAMTLAGDSIGVFTVTMSTIGAVAMLAVFALLRRVTRSTVAALLLFLPFLATSFYMMEGPLSNRYAIVNLFGTFPLRYAGPFLLAWLLGRHLDGGRPRSAAWLFVAAGLVVLNNAEFGIPALGATIAALLWTWERPTRSRLGRLALEALAGLAGALALVSALTLATAGSLPHLELLLRYSRLFALAGWGLLPMTPTIGMSTIIYLTYVAAIGAASVRAANDDGDHLMTGLLAWSGVFGLGVGSYYMGRSHPEVLTNMFPAWALCMTLLVVLAVRAAAARASRRPTLAEAACLVGFGVMACSLAQLPTPWSQVERLGRTDLAIYEHPVGEAFIAAHTRGGEAVAILSQLGHRSAHNLGIDDVTPYTGGHSMPTVEQLDETLGVLRAAGGRRVFLSLREEFSDIPGALEQRDYVERAREPYGMVEYVRRG